MSDADRLSSKTDAHIFFEKFAWHLDQLANQVVRVEHTLFEDLAIDLSGDANAIRELQNLDQLRQSLEDLALLTLRLGVPFGQTALPPVLCEKITQGLKMQDTKALLAFGPVGVAKTDCGSVDFF